MKSIEFKELENRIKSAKDIKTLARLEKSCNRIYQAGFLTPREFVILDTRLMDKAIQFE